jgi:CPA1 family monovalent cation:H+ antiporter
VELSATDSLILVGVIAAGVALLATADIVRVPFPILLVLGGLALALIPGMPHVELDPRLVLVAILPPLLYAGAYFTSLREFRANIAEISLLAVGLVLITTLIVAAVAHAMIPGLDWPTAFVLGAIVSPTDPTAATSIAERVGVPRRLVGIIDGESLVNDGTALVAYRFAVTAVLTGSFSLVAASGRFVLNVAGGIAIGLAAGYLIRQVRRRLNNPTLEVTIALCSGYIAYLPAQAAGVSGVLAAVTVGVYMGWYTPELTNAETRLQGVAVWNITLFVLNAVLFTLVGLQLPAIVDALKGEHSWENLVMWGVVLTLSVIAIRFVWLFVTSWLPGPLRPGDGAGGWRSNVILGWAGMRGAVSLAAALALPLTTHAGDPFPNRALIIFLTFTVILGTVVGQGLTFPAVIRLVGLHDDGRAEKEEAKARIRAAQAALDRLDELADEGWVYDDTLERARGQYRFRVDRYKERFDPDTDGTREARSAQYQRLRRELLNAERGAVVDLRRQGVIDDDVMRRVTRDLDLEEERLDL